FDKRLNNLYISVRINFFRIDLKSDVLYLHIPNLLFFEKVLQKFIELLVMIVDDFFGVSTINVIVIVQVGIITHIATICRHFAYEPSYYKRIERFVYGSQRNTGIVRLYLFKNF